MGQIAGTLRTLHLDLHMDDEPTFDSHAGFTYPRKERVMIATEEEMVSAMLPLDRRDYCAHLLIDYQVCRYNNMPLLYRCAHQKHAYLECERDDYLIRMKEFERERRLREREIRLAKAA